MLMIIYLINSLEGKYSFMVWKSLQWIKYVFLLENKLYLDLKGKDSDEIESITVNKSFFPFLGADAGKPV